MIESQALKFVQAIQPGVIKDNAAFTGEVIDTLGFNYLTLVFMFGATDIAMAVLKVTECDTSGGSYTDVDGADFSSPAALPDADADGLNAGVHINMINRKRFIKVAATAGDGAAGTYLAALAVLSRAETVPSTAASRGLDAGELIVIS